jgi:CheY-like chemotaxis protein
MSVSMTMPILIVDDYNTMIRIMRNLLRQLGFSNIDEANDGAAALAKMRAKDYALVISDSHMAPMSAYAQSEHGVLAKLLVAVVTNRLADDLQAASATRAAEPEGALLAQFPGLSRRKKTRHRRVGRRTVMVRHRHQSAVGDSLLAGFPPFGTPDQARQVIHALA